MKCLAIVLLTTGVALEAADSFPVRIAVHASRTTGSYHSIWNYFGYDEPNYTYMKDGRKLLSQLSAASRVPVYVRVHNLLNTGKGEYGLKWGSSNAYTEDAAGQPVYDWTIIDRIFDTYIERGLRPLVEVGFMPRALTTGKLPYRHHFSLEPLNRDTHGGWAYPPTDYEKWAELVYQFARHCVARYGKDEVAAWMWEAWNEPNIGFWRGTAQEYYKLYDYTSGAVKRAIPETTFGGPHWAGTKGSPEWGRLFLDHVLRGKNFATGETGTPLDYVAFHAKGRPRVVDGHIRMGISTHLKNIEAGFQVVASFLELKGKPVVIGESDPEGCAACSARVYPNNGYRNGTVYSSYTAAVFPATAALAKRDGINLRGALSWAFEFENQPYFDGFRSLATNGIAKPVLNVFRMFGMMSGFEIATTSSRGVSLDDLIAKGVREDPWVGARATRDGERVSILVWHYHDDDLPGPDAAVSMTVDGLPQSAGRMLLTHYRIDRGHSNSYETWKQMGSPQHPTVEQYAALEQASELEALGSPRWVDVNDGSLVLQFPLPRQGVSLIQLTR